VMQTAGSGMRSTRLFQLRDHVDLPRRLQSSIGKWSGGGVEDLAAAGGLKRQ
jgi:hypothetical protein